MSFCHTLGFADIIDNALGGVAPEHKISCRQLVTAMVLNGLGFTGRRLHMYGEYFKDKPLDRLIDEGVQPEHSNNMEGFKLFAKAHFGSLKAAKASRLQSAIKPSARYL